MMHFSEHIPVVKWHMTVITRRLVITKESRENVKIGKKVKPGVEEGSSRPVFLTLVNFTT